MLLVQNNNPQAMSNALWAYATLRYDPGSALMGAATQLLLTKLDVFNPQVCFSWDPLRSCSHDQMLMMMTTMR